MNLFSKINEVELKCFINRHRIKLNSTTIWSSLISDWKVRNLYSSWFVLHELIASLFFPSYLRNHSREWRPTASVSAKIDHPLVSGRARTRTYPVTPKPVLCVFSFQHQFEPCVIDRQRERIIWGRTYCFSSPPFFVKKGILESGHI